MKGKLLTYSKMKDLLKVLWEWVGLFKSVQDANTKEFFVPRVVRDSNFMAIQFNMVSIYKLLTLSV